MICSGTIAESTLPAISRTVERYLIVYYMDDLLRDARLAEGLDLKTRENQLLEVGGVPPGAGRGNKSPIPSPMATTSSTTSSPHRGNVNVNVTVPLPANPPKKPEHIKAEISAPSIELAPTYVMIANHLVGVKVVPIRVKSDEDFTYYLEKDQSLNYVMNLAVSVGRQSLRRIYQLYDKFTGYFTSQAPTGDARHDVIYARSGFSIKGIVLVDKNQMSESFMKSAKQVHRMHGLGWDNIILADDVNRYAYFCMQKFRGMCNSIPYQMMYKTLGGQDQVYDSIEQARMKNSSLFKTGPRMSHILGESIAERKKGFYVWNENQSFLMELGMEDLPHKLNAAKIKSLSSDIGEKIQTNDFKGVQSLLKNFGFQDSFMNTAFERGRIEDNELEESHTLALKVMKNSLPRETLKNKELVDAVSKNLAFTAAARKKKYGNSTKKAMKALLEDYIPKVKKFYDEQKEELENKDSKRPKAAIYHTIEASIGIIAIGGSVSIISVALFYVLTNAWTFIGIFASILAMIGLVKILMAYVKDATKQSTVVIASP
jgi:hypothetical protein